MDVYDALLSFYIPLLLGIIGQGPCFITYLVLGQNLVFLWVLGSTWWFDCASKVCCKYKRRKKKPKWAFHRRKIPFCLIKRCRKRQGNKPPSVRAHRLRIGGPQHRKNIRSRWRSRRNHLRVCYLKWTYGKVHNVNEINNLEP